LPKALGLIREDNLTDCDSAPKFSKILIKVKGMSCSIVFSSKGLRYVTLTYLRRWKKFNSDTVPNLTQVG